MGSLPSDITKEEPVGWQFDLLEPGLLTCAASGEELEIVFKTYGEVLDVHVISGDRKPAM